MKKIIMVAALSTASWAGFSFGGDCTNGFCNRASGRVLSTTKSVVKEVVKVPSGVVTTLNSRRVTRVR